MPESNAMPTLKESLAVLLDEAAEELGEHPTAEALSAFRTGGLSTAEEETLEAHLALCRRCVEALLFDPQLLVDEDAGVADFGTSRAWRETASRIREDALRQRLREQRKKTYSVAAVAAGLLLVPSLLWLEAERTIGQLIEPQVNAPIADVEQRIIRGPSPAQDAPTRIEVPRGSHFVTLVVPVEKGAFDTYRVGILDFGGNEIWSTEGLEVDDYDTATLALSRHFLEAGEYRVEISGLEDGEPRETWVHPINLIYF